ncbi:hypothetical protein CFC21_111157 [Triticum aestivum]|uniref:Uncharacterized protein n=4 Tax=Triticinae TaxID=1648030 RepID=A0A453T079_AEGTS|nr:uncharacterized protein LOC109776189 [Aegilops tauschii subsp. strangulata]XP_044443709.1 uncharacterized protein LOC123169923 [Triticum aestivum]KAF7111112.1 hypothetical protein CFC21_111157 [Triticum aestivum]
MAAKTTSCFTFLKEALVLPTRNPKLFAPILIFVAAIAFLIPAVNVVFIQPLTAEMLHHVAEMQTTDPSSAEYARLLEEIRQEARELVLIAVALTVVTLPLVFAKQILAFSAASTTYSGDRYSLAELLRRVTKWANLRGPLVTVGVVTALQLTFMALLGVYLSAVMRHAGVLSVQGAVFVLAFLAFMYFGVVAVVGVAVSVADEGCRGVRALGRAWRLMTRVRRKEGALLAAVMVLLPTVVSPVYALALTYARKSMAVGLYLLFGYALLSAAVQVFYIAAATVYYYEAMESKEVVVTFHGYAKIPSGEGEANV